MDGRNLMQYKSDPKSHLQHNRYNYMIYWIFDNTLFFTYGTQVLKQSFQTPKEFSLDFNHLGVTCPGG